MITSRASGTQQQQVTLPDTITQWVGKAVCVHPEAGVGLSDRESITTFSPFFVDLTLPPTVKRGEILPVKMSVFNYHDQALPVRLCVGVYLCRCVYLLGVCVRLGVVLVWLGVCMCLCEAVFESFPVHHTD